MRTETTKPQTNLIAVLAVAIALCIALAGCGSSSPSSESAAADSSSAASASASSESAGSASSAAASSPATASDSSASANSSALLADPAEYTAGNGTLDCEYMTLEVTGQDVWNHSDGTEGTRLLLHIVNKTDHELALDLTYAWDINGNEGYGLIMENPKPNSEVDTWAFWNSEGGSTVSEGGIKTASGMITVMQIVDGEYEVLGRYDFSYTA